MRGQFVVTTHLCGPLGPGKGLIGVALTHVERRQGKANDWFFWFDLECSKEP